MTQLVSTGPRAVPRAAAQTHVHTRTRRHTIPNHRHPLITHLDQTPETQGSWKFSPHPLELFEASSPVPWCPRGPGGPGGESRQL